MKQFKTPEEAIKACNDASEEKWLEFATKNNIVEEVNPTAYRVAKRVFIAGFMSGASFVSSYIINLNPTTPLTSSLIVKTNNS